MSKFDMALDDRGAVVVDILDMLLWKIYERDIVQIPLRIIEIFDI